MIEKIFGNNLYKNHREMILCFFDLYIIFVSFLLAYWIKIEFRIPSSEDIYIGNFALTMLSVLLVYMIYFILFKIHKSLWKYVEPIETLRIGLAVVMATVVLFALATVFELNKTFLSVIVTGGLLTALLMFNIHVCYGSYRRKLYKVASKADRAIIIGAGDAGYILVKELARNNNSNISVVGLVNDKKINSEISGYRVLGNACDIPRIVQRCDVEIAFIAMSSAGKDTVRRIYDLCQSAKLEAKVMKGGDSLLVNELSSPKKYPVQDVSIEDLLGRGEIKLEQNEMRSYLTGKVVVVTGSGESIGSGLCRQIVKFEPKQPLMIDISEDSLYMLEQEFNRNQTRGTLDETIEIISLIVSIKEFRVFNSILKEYNPDVVFHAAAHKHVPLMETRPVEAVKDNIFGINNVINAYIKNNVSRFIMISTDKAVNPTNVMGAAKRMTEMILRTNGNSGVTKMAAVHFGSVLGSNGSVIPIFKRQVAENSPITITDKNIIRYFMTIPETTQLVLQAGFYADKGEIFVLDMGEPVKILDLAKKMIRLSGFKPYKNIDIVEIELRPGEKMSGELRLDGETTTGTENNLIFKNNVMAIAKDDITGRLIKLEEVLDDVEQRNDIKNRLLGLIITGQDQSVCTK